MITIQSTGDVSLATLQRLFLDEPLAELTEIDERQYFFKSLDAPSWVQIIAGVDAWQALLGAGLSIYVTGVLSEAGKDSWKNRGKAYKAIKSGSQLLLQLARRIVTLQNLLNPETRIEIGLPISDGNYSALLPITANGVEAVEQQLAQFSAHCAALREIFDREDFNAVGWVILSLSDNGDLLVQWMDAASLGQREETVSLRN